MTERKSDFQSFLYQFVRSITKVKSSEPWTQDDAANQFHQNKENAKKYVNTILKENTVLGMTLFILIYIFFFQ